MHFLSLSVKISSNLLLESLAKLFELFQVSFKLVSTRPVH